jgi:hypothetical protein
MYPTFRSRMSVPVSRGSSRTADGILDPLVQQGGLGEAEPGK